MPVTAQREYNMLMHQNIPLEKKYMDDMMRVLQPENKLIKLGQQIYMYVSDSDLSMI